MPRSHVSRARLDLAPDDDLWWYFEIAERVIDEYVRSRQGDEVEFEVSFRDPDGSTREASVREARDASRAQRTPPERVELSANIGRSPTEENPYPLPTLWVWVRTDNLNMPFEPNPMLKAWVPLIEIESRSEVSEQEAVGLVEVLRRKIEHGVQAARASGAIEEAEAPTVVAPPAATPASVTPPPPPPVLPSKPWYRSSQFWHNQWVVTIGGGVILVVLGLVLTLAFT